VTTLAQLPADIEALKLFALQEHQRAESFKLKLENLEERVFGRHASEKLHRDQASGQQVLEFIDLPHPPREAPPAEPVVKDEPKKHGGGRKKIPDHLPRQRIEHTLPEEQRKCPDCGETMQPFGEEVSEQLARVTARTFVKQHARIKYCCKTCECAPKIAEVPNKVIDKGLADAGLLAEIAVQKFGDHLPLYRQEQIFARDGVHIPRSTQCAWMGVVAELLAPVVEWMKSDLLKSKKLHTDDTVIRVQDPGAHKAKIARLWVYVGDGGHPHTVFDYTRSRSREGPANFLEKFSGYLQADAFGGYDCIYASKTVIEVACWAHARRKFFESRESDGRADEMLLLIAEIYAVEKEIRELSPNLRREVRQLKTKPVLKRIDAWLEEHAQAVLPKSDLGAAIRYTRNQWRALTRFVEDGILEADNNIAENAVRPVVLGRKNYLFVGNDAGGQRAAILYSLIESCKRHGANPVEYLTDVLTRVSTHPAEKVAALAPTHWKAQFAKK
jgi:transposase